jgi:penicillin amidase
MATASKRPGSGWATGTSAEIFGPSAVAGDVQARAVFGPEERRAALIKSASKETRTILKWYAAGVNAWIEEATATGRLPVEYAGLGLDPPRPWTPDDSLAIAMALFNNFGEGGATEVDHLDSLTELVARLGASDGAAVFFDSHWLNDPAAQTSVPSQAGAGSTVAVVPVPQSVVRAASELASTPGIRQATAQLRRGISGWKRNARRAGLSEPPASNAIAIGKKLSADRRPLLLHGPQMGYTVPQINHEMGIHGGGFDVTGMILAGAPGIPIGVAKKHAWTWTTGATDNNDLYLESVNPSNPGQYQFGLGFRDFDCRLEVIPVRGAPAVEQVLCNSVHGPVLAQQPGLAITLRSAVSGLEMQGIEAVFKMMRAGTLKKFDRAAAAAVYNFNVLYADVKGNIAYWHVGKIPIRAPGDSPWLPHIGAGIAEWQGFIPWRQMPHSRNPKQGWLTSWNNKPRADWYNSTGGFAQWGPVGRVQTIMNLLETIPRRGATVGLMEQINIISSWTTDTPSGNASTVVVSTVLGDLLGHIDASADPRLPEIVALLSSWDMLQLDLDLDNRYDSPAVAIFNTWWPTFVNRVFADEVGDRIFAEEDPPSVERNVVANMAGRLLRPGHGLPLLHDYLDGETVQGAVTAALVDTLDSLAATYGSSNPADWLQEAAFIHWEPIGAASIPDTPWMNRGTYSQITRLGKGSQMYAQNVVAPGQSGNPFNPHFADQLKNYATWTYKPMRLTRQSLVGHTESTITLRAKK